MLVALGKVKSIKDIRAFSFLALAITVLKSLSSGEIVSFFKIKIVGSSLSKASSSQSSLVD